MWGLSSRKLGLFSFSKMGKTHNRYLKGVTMETRVENWNGYDIRFVNLDGDWYAVL